MIWIKAKRVLKAGLVNFFRNGLVSLATVLVVTVTLFVIGSLIMGRALLMSTLDQLQNKVDVSVYFKTNASEGDIFSIKGQIEKLGEVERVDYVSSGQALEEFKQRHKDNSLILQSLEELGDNPLGAVINIKAKQPSQYESIATFLTSASEEQGSIIDKTNYFQNKTAIERLTKIITVSNGLGLGISLVLIAISFLVGFNTIQLAIYTSKDEIGVMRLVGASNRFISGPFMVEGVVSGTIGTFLTMAAFYPITVWLGSRAGEFFGGFNLFQYYVANFFEILILLLVVGVGLSSMSSFIAIRKYLRT
jgi:cell division transport system permease protein